MTAMRPHVRTRLAVGAVALAALVALSGCSSPTSAPDMRVAPANDAFAGEHRPVLESQADRSIITTGWATILVDAPLDAASEATRIAQAAGGRVESSSTNAPSEFHGGSASVTMRIPADRLESVLDELAGLGTLQNSSTTSSDVTMQVTDLDARIGALESAIDRLRVLLAEATTTEALIQIETAITDRQAELDSLRAQQRHLEDQVAMSTLTVEFQTEPTEPRTLPDDFPGGIVAGWDALVAFASGLLVAAGVLLPWLIPVAIVALVVWLIVRAVRRRDARRSVAPPAPGGPAASGPDAVESPAVEPTTRDGWPVVRGPDERD